MQLSSVKKWKFQIKLRWLYLLCTACKFKELKATIYYYYTLIEKYPFLASLQNMKRFLRHVIIASRRACFLHLNVLTFHGISVLSVWKGAELLQSSDTSCCRKWWCYYWRKSEWNTFASCIFCNYIVSFVFFRIFSYTFYPTCFIHIFVKTWRILYKCKCICWHML